MKAKIFALRNLMTRLWFAHIVLFVFLSLFFSVIQPARSNHAQAATSDNLNFQARLYNNSGNIVSDGYYNIQFNLYSVSSGGSSLWTETRDYNGTDDRVRVVNGYFSVNLGSVTSLPNINWDQDLWLGMTVQGTGTCTFGSNCTPADSEMTPRIKLTAVPFALRAKGLSDNQGTYTGYLTFDTLTDDRSIVIPDEDGTICLQGSTNCGFAASTGAAGYIWNGTSTQTANFNVQSANASSVAGIIQGAASQTADILQLQANGTIVAAFQADGKLVFGPSGSQDTNLYRSGANVLATDDAFTIAGALTVNNAADINTNSTTALQVRNGGSSTLVVDSTNGRVGIGGPAANGVLTVGTNTTAASGGIYFGTDTNLYRSAANTLKTDDAFESASSIRAVNRYYLTNSGSNYPGLERYADTDSGFAYDYFYRKRTTGGQVLTNDVLGGMGFRGHDGSAYINGDGARIQGTAAENFGASTYSAHIDFYNNNVGSASSVHTWRFAAGGVLQSRVTGTSGGLSFGSGSTQDTNLYRSAANSLMTDDAFTVAGLLTGQAGAAITGNSTNTGTLTVNTSTATEDQLRLSVASGGAARFTGTITNADLTADRTYTLPNESGTICTTGSVCSGYQASGSYATTSLNNIASTNLSAALNVTSGNLQLQTTTSGNINITPAVATGLVNVLTGNLQVGNGTPDVTLNGEDVYIEGTLEVDGATRLDGALTVNGAMNLLGDFNLNTSGYNGINIGTGSYYGNIAIGSSDQAHYVSIGSSIGAVDAISLSAPNGAIDINAGSNSGNGVTIDATGSISIDSTSTVSNFNLTANSGSNAVLTIGASNSGAGTAAITLTADETINLNAATVVGTATTQSLFNTVATTLNIGGAATSASGGINFAGGSGSTGCSLDGSNGNFSCSGVLTGTSSVVGNNRTVSETRTVPTTVGDTVDIGSWTFSNGTGYLEVEIAVPSSSFGVSKKYLLPMSYNATTNNYRLAAPIASSGAYSGNDFNLEVNVNALTTSLRIRRAAGTTAGTAYITMTMTGVTGDTYTSSSATGSPGAITTLYEATQLTQVDNFVGIGTIAPTATLEVSGTTTLAGGTINLNASSNNATNINTGNSTGNVNIANGTGTGTIGIGNSASGAISIQGGNTLTVGGTSNTTTTLQSSITGNVVIGAAGRTSGKILIGQTNQNNGGIEIGNSAVATPITIGPTDTNGVSTGSQIKIGTGITNSTIEVGGTEQTGTLTLGQSTRSNTVNIANGTIGSGYVGSLNIGTNATGTGRTEITIGSTNASSYTHIQGGSGTNAISLQSAGGSIGIGNSGTANTIQIGNTTGAVAQTIYIGNNSTASSTNNVTIGSTVAGSTTIQNAATINLNAGTIVGSATTQNLFNTTATTINIGGDVNSGGINLAGGSGSTGCTIDGSTGNLTCTGTISGAGSAFNQNGNSFAAQAVLGTNDTYSLAFETDGTTRWILGTDGHLTPNVDDTYDIGSDTKRVKDIYAGPGTIHVGTSTSDEGTLSYNTTSNNLTLGATNGVLIQGVSSTTAFSIQDNFSNNHLVVDTTNDTTSTVTALTITNGSASGALNVYSGNSGNPVFINIGRATGDLQIGAAASPGQFSANTQAGDVILKTLGSGSITLSNGTTSVLSVLGNNVGVGVRSANAKLEVQGTTLVTTTSTTALRVQDGSSNVKFTVDTSGNITSTVTSLQVTNGASSGGIQLWSGASGTPTTLAVGRTANELHLGVAATNGDFSTNTLSGDIIFKALNSNALTFSNGTTSVLNVLGGNVGIGVRSASAKLDVRGTTQIQTNNSNAFVVEKDDGTDVFRVDTSNSQIAAGPGAVPANGVLTVGTNTTAASGGIYFGTDTNLYRSDDGVLATDSILSANDKLAVGPAGYTDLAATIAATDQDVSLLVAKDYTDFSSLSFVYGSSTVVTATPSSSPSGTVLLTGTQSTAAYDSSYSVTSQIQAGYFSASSIGTGDTTNLFGIYSSAENYGSGDINEANGLVGRVYSEGSGTTAMASGVQSNIEIVTGGGHYNDLYGFSTTYYKSSSTTVDRNYGLFIGSNNSSNITDNYGIYVGDQSGAGSSNSYNIYSAGTSSKNYFKGKVGIDNLSPGYLLHVGSSSVSSGTSVARFENAGGTCTVTPNTAGGITCTSDERLKKDISDIDAQDSLNKILGINVVSYKLLAEGDADQAHTGVIAQDFMSAFPDLVQQDSDGYYSVSYAGLTPYLASAIQAQQQQINGIISGSKTINSINVSGSADINADLTVQGATTLASLTVSGAAQIDGKLTVESIDVGNITINGHVVTSGTTPNVEALEAAGSDGSGNIEASCTVNGNDTSGTITLNTGANNLNEGAQCKITFASNFASTPRPVGSAINKDSAQMGVYFTSDQDSLTLNLANAPDANKTYKFNYWNSE